MSSNKGGPDTHPVVPNPGGGWGVRRGGRGPFQRALDNEAEAVNHGRNAGTELRIHNRDGRIGQSDSHGHDPRNVKDWGRDAWPR